jgi:hypothetical protein
MVDRHDVLRLWVAFALLGAGLVHLAVVSEHFAESVQHGLFFAVTGTVQLGWAIAAMAGSRVPAPRALVAFQVAVVAVWAASRTVGLPVPPDAWTTEPVGTADLLAIALEVVAVAATLLAVRSQRAVAAPTTSSGRLLAGAAAGALLVSALTTPALAATDAGEHAHPHGEHSASAG